MSGRAAAALLLLAGAALPAAGCRTVPFTTSERIQSVAVQVSSDPAGAAVFLDGRPEGRTPCLIQLEKRVGRCREWAHPVLDPLLGLVLFPLSFVEWLLGGADETGPFASLLIGWPREYEAEGPPVRVRLEREGFRPWERKVGACSLPEGGLRAILEPE